MARSPDVGASLLNAITSVLKAVEVEDLAKRIEKLERKKNEPENSYNALPVA
jgi:hypothetical protein